MTTAPMISGLTRLPPIDVPAFDFSINLAALTQAESIALLAWIGVVLLVFVLILLRQPGMLVLGTNERGRLTISRHALHRIIEACCEQVRGVASARACVARRRGLFCTEVRLKIRPDAKLDAIQGYLTEEISEIYQQNLGLKNTGPIEVKIVGMADDKGGF